MPYTFLRNEQHALEYANLVQKVLLHKIYIIANRIKNFNIEFSFEPLTGRYTYLIDINMAFTT